jgi:hypothetical protein
MDHDVSECAVLAAAIEKAEAAAAARAAAAAGGGWSGGARRSISLGGGGGGGAGSALRPVWVQHSAVQQPLTEVVNTLARDSTLWHRGLLATPHAVHAMMAACTLLADRLAAMQARAGGLSTLS